MRNAFIRLAEDFIIFNSEAFSFIEFTDKVLTGSSIMPQKKNPDPAELIRGRTAINYGNLNSMLTIMKGLPISYYKDLQDDKELVFDSFDTLKDSLSMSIELIDNLNTKKSNMKNMAKKVIQLPLILLITCPKRKIYLLEKVMLFLQN